MSGNNNENGSNDSSEVTVLQDLVAGGIAGSASVIVGHPFDTIKVRLQTMSSASSSRNGVLSASSGGFKSLFKGMGAPLSTAAAVNAIIFASYGSSTRLWENTFENGQHASNHGAKTSDGGVIIQNEESKTMNQESFLKTFTCGSIAGTIQAFLICPMEHIKCRLQVQAAAATAASQQLYKGPIDCGLSIVKEHGLFRGLYRGMGVTLWRETPAFGFYFATYDSCKERVENLLKSNDGIHPIPSHAHAWAASAFAGGVSGAWTWAIIYPFDVIKSKIQTSPLERHLQKGMWTVGRDIVRKNGVRHLFRGLGVTLVRAFPVNAIIFPVYEFVLMQFGHCNDKNLHMDLSIISNVVESKKGGSEEFGILN
mmetsp:Transcript_14729/g.31029  ORF Transcript_14729/g.31029 Transcript_14729/m.31029 type:complete len:368 (+) Transcript_14729:192-1295(+)|eukprot:CAMPEP_0171340676 /NCGR_PEP_ID=MMETSP0878-20121228/8730_1 /TAXON_ID=67004 /ORGANISM="Thalassiosira weissflogii, Strain CCMP1336" /LENGTH=367 /DNA_ID=CAMNT_0011842793 /DNA_START=184 /DNA_END=1287 /DNA_ORIENTATION=+